MRSIWVVVAALCCFPAWALAQSGEPEPRVIVVPYPGEPRPDAGQPAVAPEPPPPPGGNNNAPPVGPAAGTQQPGQSPAGQPGQPQMGQPPPANPNEPPPPQQPIVAQPGDEPPPPPPDNLLPQNPPPSPPSAMLDGHPREGAFLSGPGSMAFILHH